MNKILIPEELKGKELTAFLTANKEVLVSQKKRYEKITDPVAGAVEFFVTREGGLAVKAAVGSPEVPETAETLRAKFVGNTALWIDSQMDLLLPDCWKKSIMERQGKVPHLHDHVRELDAEVGIVKNFYSQEISLLELGISRTGVTQSLVFDSEVRKDYHPRTFEKYRTGRVNQHSIGLQYVRLELAINDEESEKEFDFWNKYYPLVINKDVADDSGFFWIVPEIKLIEVSAVLFGANELTPTLSVTGKAPTEEVTLHQPSKFNLDEAIRNVKFFN